MIFFHREYIQHLEKQVGQLQLEVKAQQDRNDKLVEALVPILRKMNEPKPEVEKKEPEKHSMVRDSTSAMCSCGWTVTCLDPANLQESIADHYRETRSSVRGGRKSWSQVRDQIEKNVVPEIAKEEL